MKNEERILKVQFIFIELIDWNAGNIQFVYKEVLLC